MRDYEKPFTSVDDCLALLKQRGLIIDDEPRAKDCLYRIGYYRLSAYWYPFRAECADGVRPRQDHFRENKSFSQVMDFYIFDKKLRLHVSDALERIEIAIRGALIEKLGRISPRAHRDPASFNAWFTQPDQASGKSRFDEFLAGQDRAFDRSNEEFAKHYRQKYHPHAPIWIAAGRWDWGNVSFVYSGLAEPIKREIAAELHPDLPAKTLASWLSTLNEIRNACAHHSRLWNKPLINSPSFKGGFAEFDHITEQQKPEIRDHSAKRLYGGLLSCRFLMRQLQPESQWHRRLISLIDQQILPEEVSEHSAGFPNGWRSLNIWR